MAYTNQQIQDYIQQQASQGGDWQSRVASAANQFGVSASQLDGAMTGQNVGGQTWTNNAAQSYMGGAGLIGSAPKVSSGGTPAWQAPATAVKPNEAPGVLNSGGDDRMAQTQKWLTDKGYGALGSDGKWQWNADLQKAFNPTSGVSYYNDAAGRAIGDMFQTAASSGGWTPDQFREYLGKLGVSGDVVNQLAWRGVQSNTQNSSVVAGNGAPGLNPITTNNIVGFKFNGTASKPTNEWQTSQGNQGFAGYVDGAQGGGLVSSAQPSGTNNTATSDAQTYGNGNWTMQQLQQYANDARTQGWSYQQVADWAAKNGISTDILAQLGFNAPSSTTGGSGTAGGSTTITSTPNKYSEVSPDELVENRIKNLLNPENELNQKVRTGVLQNANARGLVNSSMAEGAAQSAMIDNAYQIANADAATLSNNRWKNLSQQFALETMGKQFDIWKQQLGETRANELQDKYMTSITAAQQQFASMFQSIQNSNMTAEEKTAALREAQTVRDNSLSMYNALFKNMPSWIDSWKVLAPTYQ